MKSLIIPAILASTKEEVLQKIALLDGVAPWMQIDLEDGTLSSMTSWQHAQDLGLLPLHSSLELHVMAKHPQKLIDAWQQHPAVKRVIWHVEASADHADLIMKYRMHGYEVGLALAPETPVDALKPYLAHLDEILILGVQPGSSGQELIQATLDKARDAHALAPHLAIGFDGGVRPSIFSALADAGVTRFCMGSALFRDEDPVSYLETQQAYLDALTIPS
ncbi:MAG: hypothetical protein WCV84_01375 [Patescibacteria group bacterium]